MEKATNRWQNDLGDFFATKKIYRMDYMNKLLSNTIKEWMDYLKKFDDVLSECDVNFKDLDFNYSTSYLVTVKLRSKVKDYFPFMFILGYMTDEDNSEVDLKLKSSRWISDDVKTGKAEDDNPKAGIFATEIINGNEIFEQEFIFWKLNDLLKKWMECEAHN